MKDIFGIDELDLFECSEHTEREKALEKTEEIRQYISYTGFAPDSDVSVNNYSSNKTDTETYVGVKSYYDNVLRGTVEMRKLSDNYYAFINHSLRTYALCTIYPYGRAPAMPKGRNVKRLVKKLKGYALVSDAKIQYTGKIFSADKSLMYGYYADITHLRRLLTADV